MRSFRQTFERLPFIGTSVGAQQLAKFLLVGVTNTAWDYALYVIFTRGWLGFHMHFLAAQLLAFTGSVLNSYIFNKRWTFRDLDPRHHVKLTKFFVVNVIALIFYESLLYVLVGKLRIYDLLAKALVIVPVILWNFFANKYWTFRNPHNPQILQKTP
ncbi:MAG: GtrA family protein [bacterium]